MAVTTYSVDEFLLLSKGKTRSVQTRWAAAVDMANAFILFGLLIAANVYFFIRSRRKAREGQDDTEA